MGIRASCRDPYKTRNLKLMPSTQHPIRQLGFIVGSAIWERSPDARPTWMNVPPGICRAEPAPVYVAPLCRRGNSRARRRGKPRWAGGVVIQAEADFYEPLTPYGRWIEVPVMAVAGRPAAWPLIGVPIPTATGKTRRPVGSGSAMSRGPGLLTIMGGGITRPI